LSTGKQTTFWCSNKDVTDTESDQLNSSNKPDHAFDYQNNIALVIKGE